jgi:uncharacterized protein (TIGR03086 family)
MDDVTLLEGVLAKDVALLRGVRRDQWDEPTPCPEFSVRDLVAHMNSWIQVFASTANGTNFDGDPAAYQPGDDEPGEFAINAEHAVTGWRRLGTDRAVPMSGGELPGAMVLNMMLMEYLTHGWDLARATDQPQPFNDVEATEALTRARTTLPEEYRGHDKAFGHIVPVPDDAPALDQFIGFMGRRP